MRRYISPFLTSLNHLPMSRLFFALIASLSYGGYNFFTKLAGEKLDTLLALVLFAGTTFLFALILFLFSVQKIDLTVSKNRLRPILSGLVAGTAELFYLKTFAKSAPLTIANPLVVGGTVLVAAILGMIFLQEKITLTKIVGILTCIVGIVLLSKE